MKARLGSLLLLVLAMGFLAFAGMLYYSDVEVRSRFLTARWVAPAQVYAAPMELYRGAPLSADAVESALQRLGYRPGDEAPSQAGEYQRRGEQISIWRRSFRHGADVESDQPLVLQHRGAQLTALRDGSGAARLLDRLEPEHVGSLYPAKGEDRELLRLEDWPDLLRRGLIAVEDQRFARHFGIDPQGLLRAAVKNVLSGGVVEGGSTLTQQLVKNLFLSNERSFVRKVREAFMALLLEWHFDKGAILEAYGNEVYLGQDGNRAIHGFGLASRFWFGKPLGELYDAELALLVGMVKGPSAYNPQRRAEAARARRNLVLRIWFDTGLIDAAALAAGQEAPLGLTAGGAVARSTTAFLDLVRRELRREFPADALAYDGLRIDTHLDARLQSIAESVVRAGVPRLVTRGGE
ncbi:MAG: transglycosylase domain-containing protein, partial [Oceanococcaceae bacterium]